MTWIIRNSGKAVAENRSENAVAALETMIEETE